MHTLETMRPWLDALLAASPDPAQYGFSDLTGLLPPPLRAWPRAVTLALRLDDALIDSIIDGPHARYYAEYKRVNAALNEYAASIAAHVQSYGHSAHVVPSSTRVDHEALAGEFPHKTGAVLSGMGWIGRSSLLITRKLGPRVRLVTVLTDAALGTPPGAPEGAPPATPLKSYCGSCTRCVRACPARAITGTLWHMGMPRHELLDAKACDDWKIARYPQFDGMVCGICVAVCPYGRQKNPTA